MRQYRAARAYRAAGVAAVAALAWGATRAPAAEPAAPAGRAGVAEKWPIDAPHGPTHTVQFRTDEGTWMHLDVHPDGTRLVFALLGDLYLLPLGGGPARRLTSGPAYDTQPRFSPDGRSIAFASDRDGLENLWLCDLDGGHLRQVSHEKDSTVSAPRFTPDGDYLLGRKRLTDTSSIGMVELWLWHLQGGQGVQITKKDAQADAADPAFSPDGRFLYFSARDARYKYDRNVNEGIWQIKRLDRRTGQSVPLTGDFGGAAAPTPSPDGRLLAYVRRVRAKTRLELLELATGRTRVLAPRVDRDNQEGFAAHGVFPGFAWTPDGRAVIATAEGRFWRFDVASGERTAIPFEAQVEQRLDVVPHPPRRVEQGPVRARILRWPVESPRGGQLVFSALGHLYTTDLPRGTPHRLTRDEDFEYAPAFSPDGLSLAYVTWNDLHGGHVWRLPLGPEARGPQRLTDLPGQYANPAFSPDGDKVVFIKGSGAAFRDGDLSDELWHAIYWTDTQGGGMHYVASTANRGNNRRMPRPSFSPDGERIFFLDDEEEKPHTVPKTTLVSVKLDGTDRRQHLRWAKVEEAAVSPDGRWVLYNELHNAALVPLPPTPGTEPVDVTTDGPLPVAPLTDEGGEWVAWADQGRTLTWIYGSNYHRLALERAFPPPEAPAASETAPARRATPKTTATSARRGAAAGTPDEAQQKKDLPRAERIEIVLEVPRDRPEGLVAYEGARLITMKGDEVIEHGTLLTDGPRLVAVGPSDQVPVPPGARRVDLSGRTVIPGLFDEHAHLHYSTLDIFPQRPWKYLANLAFGVTTTHDPSAPTHEAFGQGEMVEAGLLTGPRIYSTGYILFGAENAARAVIKDLDDARRHVRRLKSLGALTVKSYMQPRRDQRQWILQAAREEGLSVMPEGGGDLEMDMTMVLDGHTTLEHALPHVPLRKDVVTLLARSGTAYTPTLLVAYGGLSGDRWFHQHYDLWKDEHLARFVPQGSLDRVARIRGVLATDPADWHHVAVAASAHDVVRAGGRVCLGAHGQMQGLGPHWEIWAFVEGGFTPLEALRAATLHPAEVLGLERDLGSLEAGKLADFVVLERNPLDDIHNSRGVELVVKNGRAYTPRELERHPVEALEIPPAAP